MQVPEVTSYCNYRKRGFNDYINLLVSTNICICIENMRKLKLNTATKTLLPYCPVEVVQFLGINSAGDDSDCAMQQQQKQV